MCYYNVLNINPCRLSQYTSAQMVHDNPNVADLSDLNRPTKLAEKLSELYDNEWTDGFEVLTENYKFTETDAIQQLLDILMVYLYCIIPYKLHNHNAAYDDVQDQVNLLLGH